MKTDRNKDPDIVFTDPEMEVELINGKTHKYPKYIGMRKEAQINKKLFDFFDSIGIEDNVSDALSVYELKRIISGRIEEDELIAEFQEIVGTILGKDADWVDANLYMEDMVIVISLFLSVIMSRSLRMRKAHERILKILDLPTSTESPVENLGGQSKKQTKPQKKK